MEFFKFSELKYERKHVYSFTIFCVVGVLQEVDIFQNF